MKNIKTFESFAAHDFEPTQIQPAMEPTHGKNHHGVEHENYMFFGNLKTIKRLVDTLLEMDESQVDEILSNGHAWADDHIATSKDDIEEVFNFLMNEVNDSHNKELIQEEPEN
jgi:hypothetical protein